jgi:hypothetical protein
MSTIRAGHTPKISSRVGPRTSSRSSARKARERVRAYRERQKKVVL